MFDGDSGSAESRHDVGRALAEAGVGQQPHLPRERHPERRARVLRDRLHAHVADAGVAGTPRPPTRWSSPPRGTRQRGPTSAASPALPLVAASVAKPTIVSRSALMRRRIQVWRRGFLRPDAPPGAADAARRAPRARRPAWAAGGVRTRARRPSAPGPLPGPDAAAGTTARPRAATARCDPSHDACILLPSRLQVAPGGRRTEPNLGKSGCHLPCAISLRDRRSSAAGGAVRSRSHAWRPAPRATRPRRPSAAARARSSSDRSPRSAY